MPDVVIVDEQDREIGILEKMAAHQAPGILHRAVSVVVFDRTGALLLQQRAPTKHHFGGLWSNTCCTHPAPAETPTAAARRRIIEEMGITVDVQAIGAFIYRAEDPHTGLVEHEFDHVTAGTIDRSIQPDPDPLEVSAWKWMTTAELQADLRERPDRYTPWLAQVVELALQVRSGDQAP